MTIEYNIIMGIKFNKKRKNNSRSKIVARKIIKSLIKDKYVVVKSISKRKSITTLTIKGHK